MTQKRTVPMDRENQLSFLSGLFRQLRLVWLLLKDSRVSMLTKSVIPLSLLYLVSPIDFVPDVILGLGQLDDFGVILLGLTLFVKLCPTDLVEYYARRLEYGTGELDDEDTIDATYRFVDDE